MAGLFGEGRPLAGAVLVVVVLEIVPMLIGGDPDASRLLLLLFNELNSVVEVFSDDMSRGREDLKIT